MRRSTVAKRLIGLVVPAVLCFLNACAHSDQIHDAAGAGRSQEVRALLRAGHDVNARSANGLTALISDARH